MLPDECIAAGELAGSGFAEAVRVVGDTHTAIAGRVFEHVGAGSQPVERAHAAIAGVAYGVTQAIGRAAFALSGRGAALVFGPEAPPLERSAFGGFAQAAISGVYGDTPAVRGGALAVTMAVRVEGCELEAEPGALTDAFPDASSRLLVFLHGLCETEQAWRFGATRSQPYGDLLRARLGYTPVYLRYNTGLHVSENGRLLAGLLAALERDWPVEVEELVLVGHSMGGLVARSACHYGVASGWAAKVRHVVNLGTPHTGAPLERAAQALQSTFARLPETRSLARALGARSAGIRDCGHGYLTDECWQGQDSDAFLRRAAREVPFLETADHYFFAASLTSEHDHPLGRYVGDLLVLYGSAWGGRHRSERVPFAIDCYRHLGGAHHFSLLNHPAVAEQLVSWLAQRP